MAGPPAPVVSSRLPLVLTVVAVLALGTWAAAIGPPRLFAGDDVDDAPAISDTQLDDELRRTPAPNERVQPPSDPGVPQWAQTVALLAQLITAIVLLYLCVMLLRRSWKWRIRRRQRRAKDVDFDVLDSDRAAATEAIIEAAAEQAARLREGSARNGIVGCWHDFEIHAVNAGIGRHAWETSSEFTLRVLDLVGADHQAVGELAALYREARFSDHPLGEPARAAAADALQRIHQGLQFKVPR